MDLTQYLSELDGQYRLYDVGRRIRKLDKQQFQQFEDSAIPYPYPYLQHAWLAMYITQPHDPSNETLWFLKWPLDEQGKIVPYVRDDLVSRLIRLSQQPMKVDSEIEDPLKDNPFSFNPDDIRRANIHSMIQFSQHRKPSSQYDGVVSYLQAGTLNPDQLNQWNTLGIQGIADVCCRLEQHNMSLSACLATMPAEALLAFSQCLEHQSVPLNMAQVAQSRMSKALEEDNQSTVIEACMRIVGAAFSDELRVNAWQTWLSSAYKKDVACLLTFATRNYDDLAFVPDSIPAFLLSLAELDRGQGQFDTFIKVVSDLLFLPGIRNLLLSTLRNPDRPELLGSALQALLNQKRS